MNNKTAMTEKLHVVQLTGGLGNQMFQYALYCELMEQGKMVRLEDESGYKAKGTREKHLQTAFHITYKKPSEDEMIALTDSSMKFVDRIRRKLTGRKTKAYEEKQFNFDEQVFLQESAYYEGCWQSEKYFSKAVKRLREDFIFRCEIPEESQAFLNQIERTNAVSLHIRRGDYLNTEQQKLYGGICTEKYYELAIAYIKEHVEHPLFFVFTNDTAWAKKNLCAKDMIVVDCNDESTGYLDMFLMSKCRHHIIANSSFSWWGAWLNPNPDKIVIAPAKWLNGRDCSDIYTKECVILDGTDE